MVRQLKRKPIEEVYGSAKFETIHPPKSQVINHGMTKTSMMRSERAADMRTQREYNMNIGNINNNNNNNNNSNAMTTTNNGYLITSNCPVVTTNVRHGMQATPNPYAQQTRRNPSTTRKSNQKPVQYGRDDLKLNYNMMQNIKPPKGQQEAMSKAITQRTCYNNPEHSNYMGTYSDKDLMVSGTHGHMHSHGHTHAHHHHHQHQRSNDNPNTMRNGGMHIQHGGGSMQSKHHPSQKDDDDEDKDDDPEEFFELIRQTVQTAVGNTVSDVLTRNLRDIGTRIEHFSSELRQTNDHLNRLQEQVTSKIVHYGEENSRHFRYLCMKSEYDKIFYQHHTMIANKKEPSLTTPQVNTPSSGTTLSATLTPTEQQRNSMTDENGTGDDDINENSAAIPAKKQHMAASSRGNSKTSGTHLDGGRRNHQKNLSPDTNDCLQVPSPCICRSTTTKPPPHSEPHKSSSERSVGNKSSDLNMREVLEHIQRFCTEMQVSNFNPDAQHPMKTKDLLANINDFMSTNNTAAVIGGDCAGSVTSRPPPGIIKPKKMTSANTSAHPNIMELYNEIEDFDYGLSSDGMSESSDHSEVEATLPTARTKRTVCGAAGDGK